METPARALPPPADRRPMRTALLLLLCLGLAACGGRQRDPVGGEDILLRDHPNLMGELEEQARGYLLDMAFVLEANMGDPERAMDRFQALLAVNGEAMRTNARALSVRLAELEGAPRRAYEAQLAAYLGPANASWRQWSNSFLAANPEHGQELFRLVQEFDRAP